MSDVCAEMEGIHGALACKLCVHQLACMPTCESLILID